MNFNHLVKKLFLNNCNLKRKQKQFLSSLQWHAHTFLRPGAQYALLPPWKTVCLTSQVSSLVCFGSQEGTEMHILDPKQEL